MKFVNGIILVHFKFKIQNTILFKQNIVHQIYSYFYIKKKWKSITKNHMVLLFDVSVQYVFVW